MYKILKFKFDKKLLLYLFLLIIISLLSIYSSETLLDSENHFFIKQVIWYFVSTFLIFLIIIIGNNFIYKYSFYLYILGNIVLLLLLIFAHPINEAKCWFSIPFIGSIQPSEFMKIVLIIVIAKMIDVFKLEYSYPSIKEEFIFLIKIIFIVFIPSFLTFLEPYTGVVIIYLLITIIMFFTVGIRIRWFTYLSYFVCSSNNLYTIYILY